MPFNFYRFVFSFFPLLLVLAACQTALNSTRDTSSTINSGLSSDKESEKGPGNGALYSEEHLDFKKWNRETTCCNAKGSKVAIAAGGPASAKAGLAISEAGGNLVDSAVAVAFCLAVERPQSNGIGGGGFMTLHLANGKKDIFMDFRETAPRKATKNMFLDENGAVVPRKSVDGVFAVATPGMVAGLYDIHRKYGKLPWKDVLAPAIKLAKDGFAIQPNLVEALEVRKAALNKDAYLKKLFFHNDGKSLALGEKLIQPELAKLMETIAAEGKTGFYQGAVAKQIAARIKAGGGILDEKDLARYAVKFPKPIKGKFQKYTFISAPPPSAGGVLIAEMLNVLNGYDLDAQSQQPVTYLNLLSEVMKRAFADRSQYIGDPAFSKTGYEKLLTQDYAKAIRKSIDVAKSTPASQIKPGGAMFAEDHGTTHMSLIDADGNAISSTLTINTGFGAAIAVPELGLILNNEMDDFSVKTGEANTYGLTGNEANSIAPLKRPVSSMVPTIVMEDGVPILSIGAGGGSRIITGVLQVILNDLVLYKGDLKKSVFAPRIHQQWLPEKLNLEAGFPGPLALKLRELGNDTEASWVKEVQAAQWNPSSKEALAVSDPRDMGGAEAK